MATMHDGGDGKSRLVYMKGGVEVVLDRCADALDAGGERVSFDADAVHADIERLASRGCASWPSQPASCRQTPRASRTTISRT